MSALVEGFKIGAEFAFDAGLASAEIGAIQDQIQGLSSAVDDLLFQAQTFGLNFAANFTGLGGGVLGVLGSAISASDKFTKAQLSFSNIIASNMDHFSGSVDTFADRMESSRATINDIINDTRRFAIPANELLRTTEIIAGLTAPIGLTGQNFGVSRDLSANYLKASRSMGLDPSQSMNQFANIVTGHATSQGMLGQRLFKEVGIEADGGKILRTAKEWNEFFKADNIKAIHALNVAMDRFTKNADELAGMTNTIGAVFQRFTDLFKGFSSILRQLGDVILPVVVQYLNKMIGFVQNQGAGIVKNIAMLIEPIAKAPEQFLERFLSMRRLAKDISDSAFWTGTVLSLMHLNTAIELLGKSSILAGIGNKIASIPILGPMLGWVRKFSGAIAGMMGGGLLATVGKLSGVFTMFTLVFQGFSRAVARVDIARFWTMLTMSEQVSDAITSVTNSIVAILRPLDIMVDGFANIFEIFLPSAHSIGFFASALQVLADVLEAVASPIREVTGLIMGLTAGFSSFFNQIFGHIAGIIEQGPFDYFRSLNTSDMENPFSEFLGNIAGDAMEAYKKYSAPYVAGTKEGEEKAVANNITNIGKVDIINNIKQEVQPDRVAFTVAEQIKKLSSNKRGSSLRMASAGFSQ